MFYDALLILIFNFDSYFLWLEEIKLILVSYFLLLEKNPVVLNEYLFVTLLNLPDLYESRRELSVILLFLDLLLWSDTECLELKKFIYFFYYDFSTVAFSLFFNVELVKKFGTMLMLGLCFFNEMFDFCAVKI